MGDRVIWVVYFFLCIISLVEVFSAASTLAYKSGSFWDPLIKQALFLSIGTLVVIAVHRVPCRVFKAVPIFMIPISLILLSVTFFMGAITNGAKRWLEIGGVPFQPSELAKGSLIIAVALVLSRMQTEDGADRKAFKYILILSALICLPIFPENLSTACLLFGVVVLMMFIGRVPLLQLGKMLGVLFTVGASGSDDTLLEEASFFYDIAKGTLYVTVGAEGVTCSTSGEPDAMADVPPVLKLAILDEIDETVTVGVSGSSLRAVQAAVQLIDWGMNTGLGADEIGEAASTWLAAKNDGLTEYLQKLEMVDDAYQKLLTDEARDMLDSAGCAGVEITWGSQPIEPIEAIMQAAGLR